MRKNDSNSAGQARQDELYQQVIDSYGGALGRLARAYECEPENYRDLLQEIHIALWRSFSGFDERCSLRTWIYRVAHNVATSHVVRDRRAKSLTLVGLDGLEALPGTHDVEGSADRQISLDRLLILIQQLNPIDRQIILLYLEGVDAASIGEITGVSAGNIATKVHRIKHLLARQFQGEVHAE